MKQVILWLKILCLFVFMGRAWQHLRWDAPYRAFFWSEAILSPVFNQMGWSWQYYVTHSDTYMVMGIRVIGVFLLCAAVCALLASPQRFLPRLILPLSSVLLFILALLYWKEKGFYIGELIEYGAQVACPWLLYAAVYRPNITLTRLNFSKYNRKRTKKNRNSTYLSRTWLVCYGLLPGSRQFSANDGQHFRIFRNCGKTMALHSRGFRYRSGCRYFFALSKNPVISLCRRMGFYDRIGAYRCQLRCQYPDLFH